MNEYIIPLTFLITFIYASYLDIKTRIIPFPTWIPLITIGCLVAPFNPLWLCVLGVFAYSGYTKKPKLWHVIIVLIAITGLSYFTPEYSVISLICLVCGTFYAISCYNVFGGADAFALIWIALFIEPYTAIVVFLIATMIGGIYHLIKKKSLMERIPFIPLIGVGFVVVFLSAYL